MPHHIKIFLDRYIMAPIDCLGMKYSGPQLSKLGTTKDTTNNSRIKGYRSSLINTNILDLYLDFLYTVSNYQSL